MFLCLCWHSNFSLSLCRAHISWNHPVFLCRFLNVFAVCWVHACLHFVYIQFQRSLCDLSLLSESDERVEELDRDTFAGWWWEGEAAAAATTRQPESGHELLFLMMAFFPGATFKIDLRDAMWRWERNGGENEEREKRVESSSRKRKVAAKNRGCDRARNDDSERRRRVIKYLCFYQKVIRTKRNMKSSPCSCAQCESWEWK